MTSSGTHFEQEVWGEGQNNDVSHDRAPLIRLIAQLWNSCSTIGLQDLANHQSWNHVNSLIAELRKMQHFCKYFLPGSAMHTKSIYTSQDFILQIDMIIILPPEVIWSKSHHPNPCYWQKTSILFHNWIRSVDGYFTLSIRKFARARHYWALSCMQDERFSLKFS